MENFLLFAGVVIIICIFMNRFAMKLPVPSLLVFIALGMCFGENGFFRISFDNYELSETICSVSLIFIMFYGGFGTNMKEARPVAVRAFLLSTAGVVLTAGFVGVFVHYCLRLPWLESILIGSVISSTDAASVFAILRSHRLNLKYGTASMLEIESGSNDPCAYMLTVIFLSAMDGTVSAGNILYSIFAQVVYGGAAGFLIALIAKKILKKFKFGSEGLDSVFLVAVGLAAYAIPSLLGGNGYLSAYISGIILGNADIPNKKSLVNFFDAFNNMMQMLIFFLLGLLVFPSQLPSVFLPSLLIALFLTFVARPAAVFMILTPFRAPLRQQMLVSWAGLRGAASIVFAIVAAISPSYGDEKIFQIVFCVVLLSLLLQGTLLPLASKKLKMIDAHENVLKTFNDYSEETSIQFIRLEIDHSHPWVNRSIREVETFPGTLIAAVLRDKEALIPKGSTVLEEGDTVIIAAKEYLDRDGIELSERKIESGSHLIGKKLRDIDLKKDGLIILIQRGGTDIIPDGESTVEEGDILVLYSKSS